VLTLYRTPESATRTLTEDVVEKLNADEKSACQFGARKESVTSRELMENLGFDERKAQRVLSKLMGVNLVRRVGKGPATRYEVIRA
jgi:predicted HTH transcriptional regulator